MTEIMLSSERELAEVIAQKLEDGMMLSIFIEERGDENDGEGTDGYEE